MNEIAVHDLDAAAARELTAEIQRGMAGLQGKIIDAYRGRVWIPLGYASWDAWCDGELSGARPALPREERREVVADLSEAGLSQRSISAAIGASRSTIQEDLAQVDRNRPGGMSALPDTDTHGGALFQEPVAPRPVTGADGKTYQAKSKPGPVEGAVWSPEQVVMKEAVERGEAVVASLRGQHKELIAWAEREELYVRIDRRSVWGNPFELPVDGDRDTVIKNYGEHYLPYKPSLLRRLPELKGKVLGCWCAPEPCHGDTLKREAEK